MEDTAVDERIRTALARHVDVAIDVDVDTAWDELVRELRGPPRHFAMSRWAAAAAVVLVLLVIGRPTIVELAGEAANFGRFVEEVVTPGAAEDDGPDPAHDPVPPGDTYRQELRRVHDRLNGVVFHRDRIERLDGADRVLEDLRGQRPELDADLGRAISQIRTAVEEDDRGAASDAHSTIEDLERKAAEG